MIIVDLDGTLCDCSHRVHLARAGQWDEFNSLCEGDKANFDVVSVVSNLCDNWNVVIMTGRNEKYRTSTLNWLRLNEIYCDKLVMRPDNNYTKDADLKLEMIDELCGGREAALEHVLCILEDRDQVVEKLRGAGFKVWQVRQGDF